MKRRTFIAGLLSSTIIPKPVLSKPVVVGIDLAAKRSGFTGIASIYFNDGHINCRCITSKITGTSADKIITDGL